MRSWRKPRRSPASSASSRLDRSLARQRKRGCVAGPLSAAQPPHGPAASGGETPPLPEGARPTLASDRYHPLLREHDLDQGAFARRARDREIGLVRLDEGLGERE